jgi:hypothetical protein
VSRAPGGTRRTMTLVAIAVAAFVVAVLAINLLADLLTR